VPRHSLQRHALCLGETFEIGDDDKQDRRHLDHQLGY